MKLELDDKGYIKIHLGDIVDEIMGDATQEQCQEVLEHFAWQKPMFSYVTEKLAEEYSRECYNSDMAKYRHDFLHAINKEQLDYYASVVANNIESLKRDNKKYWELYHYCEKVMTSEQKRGMPDFHKDIDHNYRHEFEKIVKEAFAGKLSEVSSNGKA
jgi:hypothetical protein